MKRIFERSKKNRRFIIVLECPVDYPVDFTSSLDPYSIIREMHFCSFVKREMWVCLFDSYSMHRFISHLFNSENFSFLCLCYVNYELFF